MEVSLVRGSSEASGRPDQPDPPRSSSPKHTDQHIPSLRAGLSLCCMLARRSSRRAPQRTLRPPLPPILAAVLPIQPLQPAPEPPDRPACPLAGHWLGQTEEGAPLAQLQPLPDPPPAAPPGDWPSKCPGGGVLPMSLAGSAAAPSPRPSLRQPLLRRRCLGRTAAAAVAAGPGVTTVDAPSAAAAAAGESGSLWPYSLPARRARSCCPS